MKKRDSLSLRFTISHKEAFICLYFLQQLTYILRLEMLDNMDGQDESRQVLVSLVQAGKERRALTEWREEIASFELHG